MGEKKSAAPLMAAPNILGSEHATHISKKHTQALNTHVLNALEPMKTDEADVGPWSFPKPFWIQFQDDVCVG